MPRLILKCPYLKGGSRKKSAHVSNLVQYMATRDNVGKLTIDNRHLPATQKQEELIEQIIREFPSTKYLFEYEDYLKDKTIENGSDFITIAIEQNSEKIAKRKNYVEYIANRPRVEKISTHGLFTGGDDEIVLSNVVNDVANHTGNIWTPIISLRREDAIRTGFDKTSAWYNMLSYYAPEIAESMKIPIQNFRWYAAFHNESHHPHVHMICYSVNEKDGYLTQKGIEKMKSGLVKNIFKNEMQAIYVEQNHRRDELKKQSKEVIQKLIQDMKMDSKNNQKALGLFLTLSKQLSEVKGKKVYGYLPQHVKVIVDRLVDELSKKPVIEKAYALWYEMREEVLYSYVDVLPERHPLSKQKEFKSIKNIIIEEANRFSMALLDYEKSINVEIDASVEDIFDTLKFGDLGSDGRVDQKFFDAEVDIEDEEIKNKDAQGICVEWSDAYKESQAYLSGTETIQQDFEKARQGFSYEANKGNVLAVYVLGDIYSNGLGVEKDKDVAKEYYQKAYEGFKDVEMKKPWKYTQYRIGKMYMSGIGVEQDEVNAVRWLTKSAGQHYKYAQYSLGALYHRGQGIKQDFQKAFDLYLKSANQGFPYADFEVGKMYHDGSGTEKDEINATHYFQKAFSGFERLENSSHDDKIQYRLGWMLEHGIGTTVDASRAKAYYKKSAKVGNVFSELALAKMILNEKNPKSDELKYAIARLEQIINDSDVSETSVVRIRSSAGYILGKAFLQGDDVLKDIQKALKYLTDSAELGNQYAQFTLGKLYLLGKDVSKDKILAEKWLSKSAEQGNAYAKVFLDNIDRFIEPSIMYYLVQVFNHVSKIFESNLKQQMTSGILQVDSKRLKKLKEKKIAQGHKADEQGLEL